MDYNSYYDIFYNLNALNITNKKLLNLNKSLDTF